MTLQVQSKLNNISVHSLLKNTRKLLGPSGRPQDKEFQRTP